MKSFTKKQYEKFVRRFALRSDKHTGISPLTNKNVQSGKENILVNLKYSLIFNILAFCHKVKTHFLELIESLFKMSDRPSMNQKIHYTLLCLLE